MNIGDEVFYINMYCASDEAHEHDVYILEGKFLSEDSKTTAVVDSNGAVVFVPTNQVTQFSDERYLICEAIMDNMRGKSKGA